MMRFFVVTLLFFLSLLSAHGQKVSDELKKIDAAYGKVVKLETEVSLKVYPSHFSTVPAEITKGSFRKENENFYSKIGEVTSIQNASYSFTKDDLNKTIVVADRVKNKKDKSHSIVDLDTLLLLCKESKLTNVDVATNRIVLSFDEDYEEFEKIEIYYNKNTFFLNKLVLFYAEAISIDEEGKKPEQKPRLEIQYDAYNASPRFSSEIFSEKEYFLPEKGTLRSVPRYQDYKLIDQRLKRK